MKKTNFIIGLIFTFSILLFLGGCKKQQVQKPIKKQKVEQQVQKKEKETAQDKKLREKREKESEIKYTPIETTEKEVSKSQKEKIIKEEQKIKKEAKKELAVTPLKRKPIKGKLKVAFLYIGPIGDIGWSWAHDQGRKKLLKECKDIVERADYKEFVPDGEKAYPIIKSFAEKGYHVIFTTSFGHMDATLKAAKEYPNTVFMHCSGYKTWKNMGTYFGRIYQADYLAGIVAGLMTQNNKIGYVAPHPIPEVIRGINAFTLGVRKYNPRAKVYVKWTHSWYNPEKERTCAEDLINDEEVDIMAQGQDSPTALLVAQEEGILGIGYNTDMAKVAPEIHLTSPKWDWSKIYIPVVKSVKNGTWKSEHIWWGIDKGVVDLAPFGPRVPPKVKEKVMKEREKIIKGKLKIFKGPIYDQQGKLKVKEGEELNDEEIWEMHFFVKGVVGDIPEPIGLSGVKKRYRKLDKIRAGFVYISNIGDAGWTAAHDEARKALKKLPFVEKVYYVENVSDSDKDKTLEAIESLIKDKKCNLIFTTSFGFMDPTLEMAKKYPEVIFMHCSGYKTNPNMGTYFGRMYQARYLSGLIAGAMTKANKIGYLIPFAIPECIRGLNAFTLGVREVNPNAEIYIEWTQTWYNPEKEREAAENLVDKGVDILAQHQDSPTAVLVAKENGLYAIGYDSDMSKIAPDTVLTCPIWHWDKICIEVANELHEGKWESRQIWWGLDKGVVDLAPINKVVPRNIKELVKKRKKEIIEGKFKVFTGPIWDNKGVLKLKSNEVFSDKELLSMMFLIQGIIGEIPKENK